MTGIIRNCVDVNINSGDLNSDDTSRTLYGHGRVLIAFGEFNCIVAAYLVIKDLRE